MCTSMEQNSYLSTLFHKVEIAYQDWHSHPNDEKCQQKYELAKTVLDNALKQYKSSFDKHRHWAVRCAAWYVELKVNLTHL